jgi:hypothetical protein
MEKRSLRKDGSTMWSNVVRSAVKERDGSVRLSGMNDDITKRKTLEAELKQLRRRQFESLRASDCTWRAKCTTAHPGLIRTLPDFRLLDAIGATPNWPSCAARP